MESITNLITKAAKNNSTIRISYKDSKGVITERETEPYEIKDNKYYGYCFLRNGIRAFNINNIQNVVITNNHYIPRFPVKF